MIRFFRRLVHTKQQVEMAKDWLHNFHHRDIPRAQFAISYSRASGPGGQKVNKTSSKATVSLEPFQWLNPKICEWMPKPVLDQVAAKPIRYQTKMGGVVVQSDTSRNRETNADECFRKLLDEIKACVHFEAEASEQDRKKWRRLAEHSREVRLGTKRHHSEKKRARSKSFDL